jgi:peptidoglycan biosynthesis protein MviN/MurJ (putative lipid II flippase)
MTAPPSSPRATLSSIAGTTSANAMLVSASLVATSLLGAAQALLLAFLVDDQGARDAFFAAYSVYLPLAVLASSMRSSVVPLLARPDLDDEAFLGHARAVLAACALAGLAIAAAIAVSIPLLRVTVAGGLDDAGRDRFVGVLLILIAAIYLHIHSALLSAVLVRARSFRFSAIWYPASGLAALALSAALLPSLGVTGAALGVLGGTLLLAGAHTVELRRHGVHVHPHVALRDPLAAVRRGAYLIGNAALGWSTMIGLAIAIAALPAVDGTITAYSYAFFIVLLLLNVTSLPIGLVKLPDLVDQAHAGGPAAVRSQLARTHVLALVLLAPLIVSLLAWREPLLEGVFGDALGTRTTEVLADTAAVLCGFALGSLVLQLCHSAAIAMGRWRASLVVCSAGVVLLAALLLAVGDSSVVTVAALQSAAACATALMLTAVLFRRDALALAADVIRGAAPAIGLAAVCALPRLLTGSDPGLVIAALAALGGLAAYAVLARQLCRELTAPFAAGLRRPVSAR